MEKLSLKSVKSFLSREEMRVINGGNLLAEMGGCKYDSDCSTKCSSTSSNGIKKCNYCCNALQIE